MFSAVPLNDSDLIKPAAEPTKKLISFPKYLKIRFKILVLLLTGQASTLYYKVLALSLQHARVRFFNNVDNRD
jgi:hypothetical protein